MAKVQSVATHVEEHQQRAENIAKMIEIQHSLNNLGKVKIVEPTRRLICEGDFQLWTPKRRTPRHMFLFNDFILLSKEKNYKASFYISHSVVTNMNDTSGAYPLGLCALSLYLPACFATPTATTHCSYHAHCTHLICPF